jgi:hypothetical protein
MFRIQVPYLTFAREIKSPVLIEGIQIQVFSKQKTLSIYAKRW